MLRHRVRRLTYHVADVKGPMPLVCFYFEKEQITYIAADVRLFRLPAASAAATTACITSVQA
jgi:hypothetical protein